MDKIKLLSESKNTLLFFGAIVAIGPLGMDAYLPAIPSIAEEMNTSIISVNNTLSYFLVGYGIGQFFGGPLSDQIGRKKIGAFGLFVFIIASFLIARSNQILNIQILRVIQAIGGGFSTVICLASVRDIFGPVDAGRKYAVVSMIMLVCPVIAPSLGTFLLKINWQAIFIFLAIYASGVLFFYLNFIPETHSNPQPTINFKPILKQHYQVIKHRVNDRLLPLLYIFMVMAAVGVLMCFLTNSSLIYMEFYNVSPTTFPVLFAVNVIFMIFCTNISMNKMKTVNPQRLLRIGLTIQGVACLGLFLLEWTEIAKLEYIVPLIVVSVGSIGLISPCASAIFISFFSKRAGSASAMMSFSVFTSGSVLGLVSGALFNNSLTPVFGIMLGSSILANILAHITPVLDSTYLNKEKNIL